MSAMIIRLADPEGRPAALKLGSEVLRRGGVLVIPTDTVYGLAADGRNRRAVERIYRIKRRPADKGLVRLAADREEVLPRLLSPGAVRIAEKFWPGPLTLILKEPSGETRGYRVPGHELVRKLIRRSGVELAATSANRSGEPVLTSPAAAAETFAGEVDLIIDGGVLSGEASTVFDLATSPPRLLREGPVTGGDLFRLLD